MQESRLNLAEESR